MIVQKSFAKHVIKHLDLTTLFDNMDWEPILHLSSDYYLDLVHEFCVIMLHKIVKDLRTIISKVKRGSHYFGQVRLATILSIREEKNTVTVDFNKKTIQEEPDWSYAAISSCLRIPLRPGDRRKIPDESDFPKLLSKALAYLFGYTSMQKGGGAQ